MSVMARASARGSPARTAADSEPYADVLAASFDRQPTIVMNGPPDFSPPDPPERLWHERLSLELDEH